MDLYTNSAFQQAIDSAIISGRPAFSGITDLSFVLGYTEETQHVKHHPRSLIVQPVFQDFDESSTIVAFLIAVESWVNFLFNTLPAGLDGFVVDVFGSCGSDNTFMINGPEAFFIGHGDLHDERYEELAVRQEIAAFARHGETADECIYTLTVYPSQAFEEEYYTGKPYIYSSVVLAMFIVTGLAFMAYDVLVQRQQRRLLSSAARAKKIVTSLFPEKVGERLIEQAKLEEENEGKEKKRSTQFLAKTHLKDYLDGHSSNSPYYEDPIADFFSDTTILFADICGFTAWSSTREPKQVFALLESVFSEFDA